jgi:hypothetical protein
MIITDKFAWGHIPRTGGDLTMDFFHQISDTINVRIDRPSKHEKHDPFIKRPNEIAGKDLILNIRQLPAFMLSWVQMCIGYGVFPAYRRLPMPTEEQLTNPKVKYGPPYFEQHYGPFATIPDRMLKEFTNNWNLSIRYFARLEYILEDVKKILKNYYPKSKSRFDQMVVPARALGFKSPLGYDHDVTKYFSEEVIKEFYKNNPRWAEIEKQRYGTN